MMYTSPKSLRILATVFVFVFLTGHLSSTAQMMPALAENVLVLPAKKQPIPFYWQGDSVGSKWEPHSALLIPVRLKGCPRVFFMQFDLGSPYSQFYKNKLAAIREKYPKAVPLNATADQLLNFSFKAGKMSVLAKEIVVKQFDSSTINWKAKGGMEIIGTLGADLIDGKTVVIDYPGRQLLIADSIPLKLRPSLSLSDFIYAGRRVLLPARIQGQQKLLYFDSGSSMYELLTDKKTCEAFALPGHEFTSARVKSWDRYVTANSIATAESMEINGKKIPIQYATYIDGVNNAQAEQMMKAGIGGMTGNKIFLPYQLVLDTKNKKFGLIYSH